jgi:hypothetical protein
MFATIRRASSAYRSLAASLLLKRVARRKPKQTPGSCRKHLGSMK